MTYKVVVDGKYYGNHTFPSLNNYIQECAKHPQCGAKMKKQFMKIGSIKIRNQLRGVKINKPVIIHYFYYESDKKRDYGNIHAMFDKCFLDSLQECGVIPNDNQRWVRGFTAEFFHDKENPRVEIDIEVLGEENEYGRESNKD